MSNLDRVAAAAGDDLKHYARRDPGPGRFDGDSTRAYVLETVYEGYLMHYREPRAFTGMDADLRLLAGDALYAQGLAELAEHGDLEAVTELSDLISLCAWAEASGRVHLGERLWEASERRLLDGSGAGVRAEVGSELAGAG